MTFQRPNISRILVFGVRAFAPSLSLSFFFAFCLMTTATIRQELQPPTAERATIADGKSGNEHLVILTNLSWSIFFFFLLVTLLVTVNLSKNGSGKHVAMVRIACGGDCGTNQTRLFCPPTRHSRNRGSIILPSACVGGGGITLYPPPARQLSTNYIYITRRGCRESPTLRLRHRKRNRRGIKG